MAEGRGHSLRGGMRRNPDYSSRWNSRGDGLLGSYPAGLYAGGSLFRDVRRTRMYDCVGEQSRNTAQVATGQGYFALSPAVQRGRGGAGGRAGHGRGNGGHPRGSHPAQPQRGRGAGRAAQPGRGGW